jgi:hypothetical protein
MPYIIVYMLIILLLNGKKDVGNLNKDLFVQKQK